MGNFQGGNRGGGFRGGNGGGRPSFGGNRGGDRGPVTMHKAVCDECHIKCEQYWKTDLAVEGFAIQDLFNLIGSSGEQARIDSEKL